MSLPQWYDLISSEIALKQAMDVEMSAANESAEQQQDEERGVEEKRKQEIRKPPVVLFWQLIPFMRRIFLYFAIVSLDRSNIIDLPDILEAILKCSPLMTLAIFIFRQFNSIKLLLRNRYAALMLAGHLFMIAGAMIIVFDQGISVVFLIGKSVQILSLLIFTVAFEFAPFASRLFIRSVIAAVLGYYYLYVSGLRSFAIEHQVIGGIVVAAAFTMQWRGWARVTLQDLLHGRWYELLGGLGSSFILLASMIALINAYAGHATNRNYTLLAADYTVDVFEYAGNFLLALSVLDGGNIVWPQEVAMEKKRLNAFKNSFEKASTCTKTSIVRTADWVFS